MFLLNRWSYQSPPDDPIFGSPAPGALPTEPPEFADSADGMVGDEPSPGNGATDSESGGLTLVDVQEAMTAAVSPLHDRIGRLETENTQLRHQATTPEPNLPKSDDSFYEEFNNDPQGTLARVADQKVTEALRSIAPVLQHHNTAAHTGYVAGHQNEIDGKFGAGTWQEEFLPVLSKQFDNARQQDPAKLADPEWIGQQVNSLLGWKFDTLVERRTKNDTKTHEQKDAEIKQMAEHLLNQTGLTGGATPPSLGANREPNEAEKEYLSGLHRQGINRDAGEFHSAVTSGNTLADYKSAKREREAKAKS